MSYKTVRLGDLLIKLTDGTHQTPTYTKSGIPFLSVKDLSSGRLSFADTKFISPQQHGELYKRCDPRRGDILLTKVGTTGIPVLVETDIMFSLFVSVALLRVNPELVYDRYLVCAIKSPFVQDQCKERTQGAGNQNWVITDIANTLIPLPPLADQRRIATEIERQLAAVEKAKKAATAQLTAALSLKTAYLREVFEGNEWEEISLDSVASVINGSTPKTENAKYWGG